MTVRKILQNLPAPKIQPGQLVVSVTWCPRLTAAAFVVAPKYQKDLQRTLKWFTDEESTVAFKVVKNTAIIVTTECTDETEMTALMAAKWLTLDLPCEATDETEKALKKEIYTIGRRPKTWPAILRKLARGH